MTLLACKVVEKSLTKKCYGITEGRTEGMTDRCKPVYPPLFQSGGIIIEERNVLISMKLTILFGGFFSLKLDNLNLYMYNILVVLQTSKALCILRPLKIYKLINIYDI